MSLLILKRWWLHLLIAITCFAAGFWVHSRANKTDTTSTKEVVTQSKQVEVKKEILKGQNVIDRVITKSITKAGKPKTVIKERIVQAPITSVTTTKSEVETKTTKETKTTSQNMARYSIGVSIPPNKIMQPRASDVMVDVGIRLGNLPLWATASGSVAGKFVVGVRFEF